MRAEGRPVPPWDPDFGRRHPGIASLRPSGGWPQWDRWPDVERLQSVLDQGPRGVTNARGVSMQLREASTGRSAAEYERGVARDGSLGVRLGGWHDLFNVFAWSAWPVSKATLNERHVAELDLEAGGRRSPVRDALTGLDEDGVVIAVADPALEALVRGFRWKELFWTRRRDLASGLHVFVFGHALAQKLLSPFVGVIGKATFVAVDGNFGIAPVHAQRARLDEAVAAALRRPDRFLSGAELAPLPVLGLPGWWPDGDDERFYDDLDYFRPGRRRT